MACINAIVTAQVIVGEEIIEASFLLVCKIIRVVSREKPVEVIAVVVAVGVVGAAGAAAVVCAIAVVVVVAAVVVVVGAVVVVRLLIPKAMGIHIPRSWSFSFADSCAVESGVVEGVVVEEGKDQGTEHSARKISASRRCPESFVLFLVV